jgi:hypothetical protein
MTNTKNIWTVEILDCGRWVAWVERVTLEDAQANQSEIERMGYASRLVESF